MNRPEIALTVPFILPVSDAGYGPKRGQALYTRPGAPADLTPRVTPLRDFYGFFRELEGQRVPTSWSGLSPRQAVGVFALAARRGDTLFVLLHNAAAEPLALDLALPSSTSLAGAAVQRMRWEGRAPADHRAPTPEGARWRRDLAAAESLDSSRVELAAEETALIRLPLPAAPVRQIVVTTHYAPENLRPLAADTSAEFTFTLPPATPAPTASELVFTFAAPAGGRPGQTLALTLNGTALDARPDLGLLSGWKHPIHPFRVSVPASLLRNGANTLAISAADPAAGLPDASQIVSARLQLRHEASHRSP